MDVYRKPTHTDRHLDFFSCHPLCHERSVVNTLLKKANNIPSTNKGRREETQRVKAVLRDNNYPMMSFIQNCESALTKQPAENNFHSFAVLPYIQGVSEKICRILKQQKVEVAYKPQLTINSLFLRPKELDDSDRQKPGIVYKINCTQCNFVYYGQTERSLKTRIAEHKRQWQVLTKPPKLQVMSTISATSWTLKMSRSLVDFSSKTDTLFWTRTLKRHCASMNYMGHARKLRATYDNELRFHITDEGLRISWNVCWKISRVRGIELMTFPDYTFSIVK